MPKGPKITTGDLDRLPWSEELKVPESKLKCYLLDPDHETGKHKARVFASCLGIYQDDWEFLREQILDQAPHCPIRAVRAAAPYGLECEVVVPVEGRNGKRHPVLTAWMVDVKRMETRLSSARPLK